MTSDIQYIDVSLSGDKSREFVYGYNQVDDDKGLSTLV